MSVSRARRLQLLDNLEAKYGLPRGVLYGVWGAESSFSEGGAPTSSAGAQGPFQFMPSTAAGMGVDPNNFGSAARGAARYLANYKDRGLAGMLAAYNAGPAGNPNNPETQAYIPRVQDYARQAPYLGGGSSAPRPRRPELGPLTRGPVSWYGGPNDHEDNNQPALQGATNRTPGLALYDRDTLGHWFRVRAPNGRTMVVQQTDIGPAPWTGKRLDFNTALIRALGYTEADFPTGEVAGARYLGKDKPLEQRHAGGSGRTVTTEIAGRPRLQLTQDQNAEQASALMAMLMQGRQQTAQQEAPAGVVAPTFAARPVLPAGYSPQPLAGAPVATRNGGVLQEQLAAIGQVFGPGSEVVQDKQRVTVRMPATKGAPAPTKRGRDVPADTAEPVARALQFAAGRIGVSETLGTNRDPLIDKWQRSFGLLGQPWCGVFVGKALQRAGVDVDPSIVDVDAAYGLAQQRGRGWEGAISADQARPGDAVFWDEHIGIIEQVNRDGSFQTIEGNASNAVRRNVYRSKDGLRFARPAYPQAGRR